MKRLPPSLFLFFALALRFQNAYPMQGMYGPYPMEREASGTSWQPESTPMEGAHGMAGDWMLMSHARAAFIYDRQGGNRGADKILGESMFMGTVWRPVSAGTIGFRGMFSLDPATIRHGSYPLLLQTGESADGTEHLTDAQHPHDFLMELAAVYSAPLSENQSLFLYFGLPGEPALGPPVFMHRFSGAEIPAAPIGHHWMDATHITYGVGTLGYIWKNLKIDGSIFTGREPDHRRWNFEKPRFDSYSGRVSFNPAEDWALQGSYGFLRSPEALNPGADAHRITASVSRNFRFPGVESQTTLAWGRNINRPGETLDAFLVESSWTLGDHTFMGRLESVQKDELFEAPDPLTGRVFRVQQFSLGYIYDFPEWNRLKWGVGGLGGVSFVPDDLSAAYGDTPLSFMLFARMKLF